ncbi:hypothetical protein ACS0TY_005497 [Phlomoides rotata]
MFDSIVVSSSITTPCDECEIGDGVMLHKIRYQGRFFRLCGTCVLRLHPQSFCPICFQVYPPLPPNNVVLTCNQCNSLTHSHCVKAHPNPYTCSLCLNPNTCLFKLEKVGDKFTMDGIDARKKLIATTKIVSTSLNEVAAEAKVEAERKASEAILMRKRAKEVLENLTNVVMEEKLKKKK